MLSKSSYLGKKKTKKFLSQNNVISKGYLKRSYFKTKVLILKKKSPEVLILGKLGSCGCKTRPIPPTSQGYGED